MTDQTLANLANGVTAEPSAEAPAGLPKGLAKLRAYKEAQNGEETFTLPGSGVVVSMPKFRPVSSWQRAQRMANGDQSKAQASYVTQICKFDGETITIADYQETLSAGDHIAIVQKVYGADVSEEDKAAGK